MASATTLKKRSDFLWVRGGRRWSAAAFVLEARTRQNVADAECPARFGFTVSKKVGGAVVRNRVRRRLRGRGIKGVPRGPQPATRANAAGLTARQLDVLELLREGLTDAEIAQRLVLSVKTVNHHVGAILAKLGAENRRDAARRYAGAVARTGM